MAVQYVLTIILVITLQNYGSAEDLRITTILEDPYVMVQRNDAEKLALEGFIPDLIEELSQLVGFNYSFQLVRDGRYGAVGPNGEWNGMVGELLRDEADIAAAGLTITTMRETVVDFTKPFLNTGIQGIKQRPTSKQVVEGDLVETLEELGEQDDIIIGMIYGGSTMEFFRTSNNPIVQQLWNKVESKPVGFCRNMKECIEKVKELPHFVFFTESVMLSYIVKRDCALTLFGPLLDSSLTGFGLALSPGNLKSWYLEKLNAGLLELKQDGIVQQLYNKWWRGVCDW